MTDNEYLQRTLASQNLAEDSDELKALRRRRDKVEKLLRKHYGSVPKIGYGGSMAKGTMNLESFDLDVICYFPHDSTVAGKTLEDIYDSVCSTLENDYFVERRTSALRLRSRDAETYQVDFHIDVVPGRYIDDTDSDVFLHQESGTKECLKTNLQVHIDHVRNSGVVDAIRLMKLWLVRNAVPVRQFVLELLTVKLLAERKTDDLTSQLEYIWAEFRDHPSSLAVEDPANPNGNDLSKLIDAARWSLCSIADSTLRTLSQSGWEAVYPISAAQADRGAGLRQIAAAVPKPIKPWSW
jgi:hypothetical protein